MSSSSDPHGGFRAVLALREAIGIDRLAEDHDEYSRELTAEYRRELAERPPE